ncbi:VanZ like protein [Murinocardiopsis flavida]|uniref:VanZ like protein n=1 Tax=Murinocardiopsis flavida TaxID=645275 RepID=A0A2P8DPA4_9ACTN|nr:VanZ family protein [Murinocardiopsis flavida]PSK99057.1 VanZ like protein [Murinocardiopsis flavida]
MPSDTEDPAPPARPWWRRFAAALLRAVVLLAAFAAMVAFAVLLARVTLTPVPGAVGTVHHNLHPGESLRFYLDAPARDAIRQVGGNVLLGTPFGVLLPLLLPGVRGTVKTLLATATAMLLVEIVQGTIVTGRAFDIDDVILNTTGALLGYLLLGRRISRAVHRRTGRP